MRSGSMLSAILLLLLLATGCRYTAAPADLLQKPSIAPEKQAIVQAIQNTLPVYSKLTLPLREENMGAIHLIDVDGDGTNEAIVSYYNEYSTPELMVFKYTTASWKPWVLVQQPLARQMEWLKLEDLNQDGQLELIAGWIGGFDSPNVLEIYSFQSKPVRNEAGKLIIKPLASLPYTFAETGDLDDDGKEELAIISESGMNQALVLPAYHLTIYNWDSNGLQQLYTQTINDEINHYDRLLIGRISHRHNGLIIEASTGAHGTYQALYAWERGKLRLIYPSQSMEQDGITGKSTMSGDFNHDGILELQWAREAPGHSDVPYSDSKWIDEWMQWDGREGFTKIAEEFSDYSYGMQLRIPDSWIGRYTLRLPEADAHAILTIEYWNEVSNLKGELATLYAVPQQQWGAVEAVWKEQGRAYKELQTNSGNVFAAAFIKEAPEAWTAADKQAFDEMAEMEAEFGSLLSFRQDY
ncbi:hypothetical protein [Paenibacillus sp. sgz302251]|uniref:hypothetical protein n=1 Tax=Paenibacillus sp. sgz302251 TaxID=3414493 RepID=UPI003C7A732B